MNSQVKSKPRNYCKPELAKCFQIQSYRNLLEQHWLHKFYTMHNSSQAPIYWYIFIRINNCISQPNNMYELFVHRKFFANQLLIHQLYSPHRDFGSQVWRQAWASCVPTAFTQTEPHTLLWSLKSKMVTWFYKGAFWQKLQKFYDFPTKIIRLFSLLCHLTKGLEGSVPLFCVPDSTFFYKVEKLSFFKTSFRRVLYNHIKGMCRTRNPHW